MNREPHPKSRIRLRFLLFLTLGAALLLSPAVSPAEDRYDPQEAGHPLRVAAYLLAPVGVVLDYCFMRPAFWLVQREPFRTVFGYDYVATASTEAEKPEAQTVEHP